jgi:hypothetical protein
MGVLRTAEGGKRGISQQSIRSKVILGVILLFLTPALLFVKINTAAILRDLALVIWWAFIIWLLVTGFRERKPPVTK